MIGSPTPEYLKKVDSAEERMRRRVDAGRAFGLPDASRFLEFYLDVEGRREIRNRGEDADKIRLSRSEARKWDFIADAERENRKKWQDALLRPRPDNARLDYRAAMLALGNGKTITLPKPDPDPKAKHRGDEFVFLRRLGHLGRLNVNEFFAVGSTNLRSYVEPGAIVITRQGNKLHIRAIVEHEWKDPYDFDEDGPIGRDAKPLERYGRAASFDLRANWHQELVGTIEIRDNELVNPKFEWHDMPPGAGP